jgi:hypothetical protein
MNATISHVEMLTQEINEQLQAIYRKKRLEILLHEDAATTAFMEKARVTMVTQNVDYEYKITIECGGEKWETRRFGELDDAGDITFTPDNKNSHDQAVFFVWFVYTHTIVESSRNWASEYRIAAKKDRVESYKERLIGQTIVDIELTPSGIYQITSDGSRIRIDS